MKKLKLKSFLFFLNGIILFEFCSAYPKSLNAKEVNKKGLEEINSAIDYLIINKSVTGEVLTLDSGQSLGWANSKSKVFSTD